MTESLAGRGQPVCYIDFDGCIHHCNVRWSEERGLFLEAPARYRLFQHVGLLEQLLAPHPAVRLVLSTSWAQKLGLKEAAGYLPESLRTRVIGATYEAAEPGDFFAHLSRGEQVVLDVQRRKPSAWLALDDDRIGWPAWAQGQVVFTDPYEGISIPELQSSIRAKLTTLASDASPAVARAAAEETRRRERRLAMHLAAVHVLRQKPERADKVRGTLDRWESDADARADGQSLFTQWRQILDSQEWARLLEESEAGEHLRKGSPFGFVLDDEERLGILRKFGSRTG